MLTVKMDGIHRQFKMKNSLQFLTVGEGQNVFFFSKYRGGGTVFKVFHEHTKKKSICQLNHPGQYLQN
jgi:hypothetical protein